MAIIIEDGTGLSTAESYISVADATTYLDNRGKSGFSSLATDALREQALRKATDYMEQKWRLKWTGLKNSTTQALSFPRTNCKYQDTAQGQFFVDNNVVPPEVGEACAELAELSITEDFNVILDRQTKREKIDVLEVEYVGNESQEKTYRAIERIVAQFFGNDSYSREVHR